MRSRRLIDATISSALDLDIALAGRVQQRRRDADTLMAHFILPAPLLMPNERLAVETMVAAFDEIGQGEELARKSIGADRLRVRLLLYLPKYEEALAWSERELRGRRDTVALALKAKALEGLGRLHEAAEAYEEYAETSDTKRDVEHWHAALLHAARLHEQVARMPGDVRPGKTLRLGKESEAVHAATRLYEGFVTEKVVSPYRQIAIERLLRMRVWRGQSSDLAPLARAYVDGWSGNVEDFAPSLPTPIEILRFLLAALPKHDTAVRGELSCLLGERLVKFDNDELEREAISAFGACGEAARLRRDAVLAERARKGLARAQTNEDEIDTDKPSSTDDPSTR